MDSEQAESSRPDIPVYQLKVSLKGIRPPIWRRLQVPCDVTLARLHKVIQIAMGWGGYHFHEFRVGRRRYGVPDPEVPWDVLSERSARLFQVAPGPKSRIAYTYDFGDGWEHDILVEKVLPAPADTQCPVCTDGRRACPPEDCGGAWGYSEILQALQDPENPDNSERLDWLGDGFDPEAFDLEGINRRLGRLR